MLFRSLNAAQSYAATLSPYIIYNTDLGYAASSLIEAGVWKVSYTNYFANGVTVSVVNGSPTVTYPSSDESFTGISYLKTNTGGTPVYYAVSAINPVTNTFTLTANYASTTNATYSAYNVGYEAIECFVIADSIKNCLDGKVAALPGSNCPCKEQQMQKLIFNYMLYDAMLINAANNNQVKAQYIYDILSNYCSESDCNCNG